MNTPRLRRGGDSFLFIYFIFHLYWYSYIVYFVCDSASEFGAILIHPGTARCDARVLAGFFCHLVFEGTLVIGLILRSLWGLYKIHETLWFYLVAL